MKPTVIYISGLGDRYDWFRAWCLRFWPRTVLLPMKWYSAESFESKLTRLEDEISRHKQVILLGESAGATMALQVAMRGNPRVVRYVTLCGVCDPSMPIHPSLRQRSPAFEHSTRSLQPNRIKADVMHFRAWRDPVVTAHYSSIAGNKTIAIASIGHLTTIIAVLTIYSIWFRRCIGRNL